MKYTCRYELGRIVVECEDNGKCYELTLNMSTYENDEREYDIITVDVEYNIERRKTDTIEKAYVEINKILECYTSEFDCHFLGQMPIGFEFNHERKFGIF